MNKSSAMATSPAVVTSPRSRWLMIAPYVSAAFLYWLALYLYVPTLPVYVQSKSENLALVGTVLAMYGLVQLLVRLPLGILADWAGWRKPFIVVEIGLVGLGAWLLGTAGGVNDLIIGRATTGMGAATWVLLVVAFSSLFPPAEAIRASAMLTMIGSIGRLLAMSVTGSLNELGGYSLAFFLAAGAAGLSLSLILYAWEKRRPSQPPSFKKMGTLITRRDVLLPSLLNVVNQYAEWATVFGFLPILARQLGATDVLQSMLMSLYISLVILGNLVASAIVKQIGAQRLIVFSFCLFALGIGLAAVAPGLPLLFAAQLCLGLGQGIGYPVLLGMSIQHVAETERATAMGLHQAIYAVGMFAGPWLSGLLAEAIGLRPMFGVTAGVCLMLGWLGSRWLAR